MRIVVAPDSFKGSMSAVEAAESICRGIKAACPAAAVRAIPLSDGGEGLAECLVAATGGKMHDARVSGPLGELLEASWGLLGDGTTAVIEIASASGLTLVPAARRDPRVTTTRGTGELIKAALDHGCRKIILGLGGSATNDGGSGMMDALGVRFLDGGGRKLTPGGRALLDLEKISVGGLDQRLKAVELLAACDVDNPLVGHGGASRVFGPQKGATQEIAEELDRALERYAQVIKQDLGQDVRGLPGAGAAGGVGAAVAALLEGSLKPGIELVTGAVGLEDEIACSNLVVTGEGRFDPQSAGGKVPVGVARLAQKHGVPVIVLAGSHEGAVNTLHREGVTAYFSILNRAMTLEEAMAEGRELIALAAEQLIRFYCAARSPAVFPGGPEPLCRS